ncbi:MAG TPA: NADH-quinone oxidoreductase subunit M, partial [Candidatus Latescibacteria bacterium]|nr:NADH-quinone oxidoreductase subunit M [Candidatus Latescibacterota bacterium]
MSNILSWLTFLPLVGMAAILVIPTRLRKSTGLIRYVALGTTLGCFALAAWLFFAFDRSSSAMQFVENADWIPYFSIRYTLGVDGLSILMVLLTQIIGLVGVIASWNINKAVKGYFALYLLLQTGMTGVFCALDFVLFYVFWEVMLLPMYFLIGIWGGPRKEYAAIKFFLYTLLGSVLMLLAILALYLNMQAPSFSITAMADPANFRADGWLVRNMPTWFFDLTPKELVWLAFFVGFAIKIPAFPFHTWLPDAHVEAPTAISVILAGILLKMGTYGILRVNFPILPAETVHFATFIAVIAVINIVYGALCAMAQKDLKSLVAYSSISHMGYVMLGMVSWRNEAGLNGAVLQMFNHGTITAMLFLLVGVVYDRAHHRRIDGFGGLWAKAPVFSSLFVVASMAALGLPGLSGFISELLVFMGAFASYRGFAVIASSGIVLGAAYLLWTI